MSERNKPHNGRDVDGKHVVTETDVEELQADPEGLDHLREDVRHGGAVADIGLEGVRRAKEIEKLVQENRLDVAKTTGHST